MEGIIIVRNIPATDYDDDNDDVDKGAKDWMSRSWKCAENSLTEQTSNQETPHKIMAKIAYL